MFQWLVIGAWVPIPTPTPALRPVTPSDWSALFQRVGARFPGATLELSRLDRFVPPTCVFQIDEAKVRMRVDSNTVQIRAQYSKDGQMRWHLRHGSNDEPAPAGLFRVTLDDPGRLDHRVQLFSESPERRDVLNWAQMRWLELTPLTSLHSTEQEIELRMDVSEAAVATLARGVELVADIASRPRATLSVPSEALTPETSTPSTISIRTSHGPATVSPRLCEDGELGYLIELCLRTGEVSAFSVRATTGEFQLTDEVPARVREVLLASRPREVGGIVVSGEGSVLRAYLAAPVGSRIGARVEEALDLLQSLANTITEANRDS